MKKKKLRYNVAMAVVVRIVLIVNALAVTYLIIVVGDYKDEIVAWQKAVEPIFTTRPGNDDMTATISPDDVKNKLNPCIGDSYLDRGAAHQRGCNPLAEPWAPVVVSVRFVHPDHEMLIERHL